MASYLGDFTTSNTVYVYFNTFDSNDPSASVTLTGLAVGDILIYKNGSVTERSSTAGYTLLDTDGIDFDGKTGIHGFSIDLSNNTDSGFFAAGGEYTVVVASVTVDAATVNFVAAHFSIERTGGALALLKGTNSLADIESKIDTLTTNVATVDTVVDGIVTTLGTPAGASVSADVAAVKVDTAASLVDTAEIGAAGAGLTAVPWNAAWDAEVQSEVADALTAYDPPTKAELDSAVAPLATGASLSTVAGYLDTEIAAILSDTNAILVDTAVIGAAGAGLTAIPWNASWDAEVQSEVADALAAFWTTPATLVDLIWDEPTSGHATAGTTGLALTSATAPTAAAVADAVWDEVLSGHLTAGTTGEALNAAGAAGDPWTTALPGAYGAGSAGYIVGTNLDAPLSTIDTNVDAILADTADMQPKLGTPAGASMSADIAAVKVDTAAILVDTDTTIPASIAALPTATENADELLNRDMSAVSDTNARTPLNAFRFLRNKYSISGTTLTVTKEDDTTAAWTSALTTNASAEPVTGSDPA